MSLVPLWLIFYHGDTEARQSCTEVRKCQKLGNKLIEAILTAIPSQLSGLGSSKIVISRELGVVAKGLLRRSRSLNMLIYNNGVAGFGKCNAHLLGLPVRNVAKAGRTLAHSVRCGPPHPLIQSIQRWSDAYRGAKGLTSRQYACHP